MSINQNYARERGFSDNFWRSEYDPWDVTPEQHIALVEQFGESPREGTRGHLRDLIHAWSTRYQGGQTRLPVDQWIANELSGAPQDNAGPQPWLPTPGTTPTGPGPGFTDTGFRIPDPPPQPQLPPGDAGAPPIWGPGGLRGNPTPGLPMPGAGPGGPGGNFPTPGLPMPGGPGGWIPSGNSLASYGLLGGPNGEILPVMLNGGRSPFQQPQSGLLANNGPTPPQLPQLTYDPNLPGYTWATPPPFVDTNYTEWMGNPPPNDASGGGPVGPTGPSRPPGESGTGGYGPSQPYGPWPGIGPGSSWYGQFWPSTGPKSDMPPALKGLL